VASQFEALQDPAAEPGVLQLDATAPVQALAEAAVRWLRTGRGSEFNNA
jgi:gluconokinase